jgi:hypothetical protein
MEKTPGVGTGESERVPSELEDLDVSDGDADAVKGGGGAIGDDGRTGPVKTPPPKIG